MGQRKLEADLRIQRWQRVCVGLDISIRSLAENLGVAASTLARVVAERSAVSPEMALRLSKALGRSPESWLAMQDNYNLWQARKSANLSKVRKINGKSDAYPITSVESFAPLSEQCKSRPATNKDAPVPFRDRRFLCTVLAIGGSRSRHRALYFMLAS
jgi:addiction module HigA family antidote